MKIIDPSYEILSDISSDRILKNLERAGRVCYKSEDRTTRDSAEVFVYSLMKAEHLSVLEHESISVRLICNLRVANELTRHRFCSFSQESSRFCNYSKDKFGHELTFIMPEWAKDSSNALEFNRWKKHMGDVEHAYFEMLETQPPDVASDYLPKSTKTELIITANLREWLHIFELRTSYKAHPDMKQLILALQKELQEKLPVIFKKQKGNQND